MAGIQIINGVTKSLLAGGKNLHRAAILEVKQEGAYVKISRTGGGAGLLCTH